MKCGKATERGGPRSERGAALFVMLVTVVVAAGLSMALLSVALGRKGETEGRLRFEQALSVAEAGLARGLAEANLSANRNNPTWPPAGLKIDNANNPYDNLYDYGYRLVGEFEVEFFRGDTDGRDNDADGGIDGADPDLDEGDYVTIVSTGYSGAKSPTNIHKVRVEGAFLKVTNMFDVQGAVFVDDATPDFDLGSSKSYTISGDDHSMYDDSLTGGSPLPALTTTGPILDPADTATIANKSPPSGTQITGQGSPPTDPTGDGYDFDAIVEFALENVDADKYIVGAGTNLPGPFGTPPGPTVANPGSFVLTYHDAGGPGNLVKFTGSKEGAGIWVVDGDLEIGGGLNFVGIVIVTGQVRFVGGGSTKMVLGAVISGDSGGINFSNTGTVDLHFSSGAVAAAQAALAKYVRIGYRKLPQN